MNKSLCRTILMVIVSMGLAYSKITISILYFDNLTKEEKYTPLSKALTEMLISDLHALKGVTFIEREKLENVLQEMALEQSGLINEASAPKFGTLTGAQYLISGSYLTESRKILITYKIIQVKNAKVVASGNIKGKTGDILAAKDALAASVAGDILAHFEGTSLPDMNTEEDIISMDKLTEFGKALDYKDHQDYRKAGIILKNMVVDNPDYQLFKDQLKDVESRLASYDEAREKLLSEKHNEPVTYQTFMQMTGAYSSSLNYSKLLEYCLALRNTPPDAPSGSMIQTSELIDYYIVLSLFSIHQFEGTVKEGEYFVKNWPTSMYYNSVKMFLEKAINEMKAREGKVKKAEIDSKKYLDQIPDASEKDKSLLFYQIASVYYGETLYNDALNYFEKIDLTEIGKHQIPGDLILFEMFMCHYGLLNKDAAKKIIARCEKEYPASDYISGMKQMVTVMAE